MSSSSRASYDVAWKWQLESGRVCYVAAVLMSSAEDAFVEVAAQRLCFRVLNDELWLRGLEGDVV